MRTLRGKPIGRPWEAHRPHVEVHAHGVCPCNTLIPQMESVTPCVDWKLVHVYHPLDSLHGLSGNTGIVPEK